MFDIRYVIIFGILTFFVGGIPFGLLIGKLVKKVDIRKYGSGSIGATNVTRVIGFRYGFLTFLLDGLKSFLPVILAKYYFDVYVATYISFFAVMGHIFSPWLRGKGGKGISSFILSLLAIDCRLFLIMGIVWLICYKVTKISALSALTSTSVVAIVSFFIVPKFCALILCLIVCIIFYAHRSNIQRLINGEELSFKKTKK